MSILLFFDLKCKQGLVMHIFYKSHRYLFGLFLSLLTLMVYQEAHANYLGISNAQINELLAMRPMQKNHPQQTLKSNVASRVTYNARKMLNIPYLWGGTTLKGFDCSGLVQYIYKREGIKIPRTAAQQYKALRKVKRSTIAKGDLVFFHMSRRGRYVDHVGIYIGNGKFIHAPGRGKYVKVSKFSSFWKRKTVGVGRAI